MAVLAVLIILLMAVMSYEVSWSVRGRINKVAEERR
jgi:hypothetical protein